MLVRVIIVALVASAPELAAAALCHGSGCSRRFQFSGSACGSLDCCWAIQGFRCSDGTPTGSPMCAATTGSGVCAASCDDPSWYEYDSWAVPARRGRAGGVQRR